MKHQKLTCFALASGALISNTLAGAPWKVGGSKESWMENTTAHENLKFDEGMAVPTDKNATLQSKFFASEKKKSAKSLVITQSPVWENWQPISNIGPANLRDAPVFLSLGPDDYWMFGRHPQKIKGEENFTPEDATLEGFDIPLKTTLFKNQYNAPGGLKKRLGGYHAWQSRDMVNWVHHGPVTERFAKWMTTAEFVDGKAYFYYDFPNDQDPHVYVDDDLTDGLPGENKGMAFKDPSHGSDCAIIRDLEGNFHLILEDWSPIHAKTRSWDSPLAVHAVSPDGLKDFKILDPPVDERTKPTGKTGTYKHPHWVREDPKNYSTNVAEYEIHEPKQEAYGDWAAISVGGQYYLFGDYDPADSHTMSVGWFTSSDINKPFTWCSNIGEGHPDPDIMFAEGQFYLATQQKTDFVSPGPWVEKVEARVGVDTSNDGAIDVWSEWQEIKESYDYIEGFSKQVAKAPAELDVTGLPEGHGFQFEVRMTDTTDNKSKPILEHIELNWK